MSDPRSREILELRNRLTDYIKQIRRNFNILSERLDKIDARMDKISEEIAGLKGTSIDSTQIDPITVKADKISKEILEVKDPLTDKPRKKKKMFSFLSKKS